MPRLPAPLIARPLPGAGQTVVHRRAGRCGTRCKNRRMAPRFITLADVADTLALSSHQTYQLVRSGQLRAIKIGGQWRVEVAELESFVERMYEQTETYLQSTEGDEESVGPLSSSS